MKEQAIENIYLSDKRYFHTINGLWIGKKPPFIAAGVIRNTNFSQFGEIDFSKIAWLEVEEKQLSKRQLLYGDIVIEKSGGGPKQPVGRVVLFDKRDGIFSLSNFTSAIRVKDHEIFDPRYVLYNLLEFYQSGKTEVLQSHTTGIRNLNFSSYLDIVSLPKISISDQHNICWYLDMLKKAIEQQERLIALTQELKSAMMHKLFTEGLHGEPQKQTEIGLIPESWEQTKLGDLAKKPYGFIQTGPFGSQLHKDDYTSSGIPVINPANLVGNRIGHTDLPFISEETSRPLKKHIVHTGDIVFGRRGEIGRHGIVTNDEDGWFCGTGSFLVRIVEENISNGYINIFLSTPPVVNWLNLHAGGVIMANLSTSALVELPVFFPQYEDQEMIADTIASINKKIDFAVKKKEFLEELFSSLLHQLMTGQIRVNEVELPDLN